MLLNFIRALFFVIAFSVLFLAMEPVTYTTQDSSVVERMSPFVIGLLIVIAVLMLEFTMPKKAIKNLAGVFFGLLVGMLISWALTTVVDLIHNLYPIGAHSAQIIKGVMSVCICFLVVSLVIKTKDDVRFVIPYVEFSRQSKGIRPLVLDTSVIIDGRIADICQTKVFDAPLIVPRFVLNELQLISDSADKLKRNRGRRGLDMLNKIRNNPDIEVVIDDTPPPGLESKAPVDQKLVAFSKNCDGRLVTNDYNLNKVAQLREVDVININDIANSLKAIILPGELMEIRVIKPGEEYTQGIGYLEDGTMVVIEDAKDKLGKMIMISVTSSLQTSAGRMIFGKFEKFPSSERQDVKTPNVGGGDRNKYASSKNGGRKNYNSRKDNKS